MILEYGAGLIGFGHYLPAEVESNEELCKYLDGITPGWIVEKTGITQRFIAAKDETASGMAVNAARAAIANAGINIADIGLIIGCTYSHDYQFPPLSAKMQKELGAKNAQVFDLQANCAGFVTGLKTAADSLLTDKDMQFALVIGVELHTRFSNRSNHETSMFLSDGAGAAILGKVASGSGIIGHNFHADTSTYESVRLRGGGSSFPPIGREQDPAIDYMEMNGLATWKQAITNLPVSIRKACAKAGITTEQIDFLLFHQANLALIQYIVKKMKLPLDKTFTDVERVGNTGSASLAIVLSEAHQNDLIKKDSILALSAVGAGFIFGTTIWKM